MHLESAWRPSIIETYSTMGSVVMRRLIESAKVTSLGVSLCIIGCVSAPPAPPSPPPVAESAQAVSAPGTHSGASALSYGMVTSQVLKDKTTQADLLQLFGGPNIATSDNEGNETWVYERSVTQTDISARNQNWQAAAGLNLFFPHVSANAQGGGGQGVSASSIASSFRSLTVVVKFNPNKTVKSYDVRSSQF